MARHQLGNLWSKTNNCVFSDKYNPDMERYCIVLVNFRSPEVGGKTTVHSWGHSNNRREEKYCESRRNSVAMGIRRLKANISKSFAQFLIQTVVL